MASIESRVSCHEQPSCGTLCCSISVSLMTLCWYRMFTPGGGAPAFAGGGAPPAFAGEPGASTCCSLAGRHRVPSCKSCSCNCGIASSAPDRGRARAEFTPLLSRSAIRPIDPATDDARASSSSPSATSSLACASSSCRLAVSRLALANERRWLRSADEATECVPELLKLQTTSMIPGEVGASRAATAGAAGVVCASLFAGGTTALFSEVTVALGFNE